MWLKLSSDVINIRGKQIHDIVEGELHNSNFVMVKMSFKYVAWADYYMIICTHDALTLISGDHIILSLRISSDFQRVML